MFLKTPSIFAHKSAVNNGVFVTPQYIIGKDGTTLFNRICPHRQYPIAEIGDVLSVNIICDFHGRKWNLDGTAINNSSPIKCSKAVVSNSGLIHNIDFVEPNHWWVTDLKNTKNLEYSHVRTGRSTGSWLWMMEIQADLLHVDGGNNPIHPALSRVTNLDMIKMEDGDGWILQTCSSGWWLFIYPFTFIEWSQGCLAVNYTTPNNLLNEFGFSWVTQYYFEPNIDNTRRLEFENYIEPVFLEDVAAIEQQVGPWYPIVKSSNRLEDHCEHFGKWVKKNRVHQ